MKMTKDRWIQVEGKTLAPFPLYPAEVIDEGKIKDTGELIPKDLFNESHAQFAFSLIEKEIE